MTADNKSIIHQVNAGFMSGNTEAILTHLTDDIRWEINGVLSATDKEGFRKEVKNEGFMETPLITVTKMIAEDNYVAAEGTASSKRKDGSNFECLFFDIYKLEEGKIKEMRSYVIEKK